MCKVKTSEDGDAEFAILKAESTVNRIAAAAWSTAAVSPENFFAYRGDLDKDGSQEMVVVSLEGVSNGMGVTYATAYIFNGKTVEQQGEPVSFSLQEFGERDNFIYNPASRRTEILISYWGEYSSLEPKRITGVYLIGKWFRYRNGKLEPIFENPTLARRFLNSFAAERDNGWFDNRKPYTWLKDRRTHKLHREPDELTGPVKTEEATITKFIEKSTDGDEVAELDFITDGGQVIKGKLGGGSDEGNALKITAFGIWKERYLFPLSWSMDFRPATFFDRVDGRRVRLETYKTEYGREFTKVWLLD